MKFSMIELLLLLMMVLLAKRKPQRRRRYRLRGVRITTELALGTLASDVAVVTSLTGNSDAQYRAISVSSTYSMVGITAGDGPITVGLAHSDYTVTEIKENMESAAAISPGLKIEQERTNRLVRVVGTLRPAGVGLGSFLNDGEPVKTRLNWLLPIGKSVNLFAFNEGTGALSTGAIVHMSGKIWVADS